MKASFRIPQVTSIINYCYFQLTFYVVVVKIEHAS